jgi:hypothetical protein
MTKLCVFEEYEGQCRCANCGKLMKNRRGCEYCRAACNSVDDGPPQEVDPSLTRKAANYCKAINRWRAAGMPNRTDADTSRVYAICESNECGFFNAKGSCRICGCKVSRSRHALFNKIRMATESCPKGIW